MGRTLQIASTDRRIIPVQSAVNAGTSHALNSHALNLALEHVSGDFVLPLDVDGLRRFLTFSTKQATPGVEPNFGAVRRLELPLLALHIVARARARSVGVSVMRSANVSRSEPLTSRSEIRDSL